MTPCPSRDFYARMQAEAESILTDPSADPSSRVHAQKVLDTYFPGHTCPTPANEEVTYE